MSEICWNIDFNQEQPLYLQLYEQVKNELITNSLPQGAKLPSIRQVAKRLAISKTTVESAYHQLEMEGYIYAKKQSGYFACDFSTSNWHQKAERTCADDTSAETKAASNDFGNDYIAEESFDFALWRKYINQTLLYDTRRFCDYGEPMGAYELRRQLASYLHQSRGVNCSAEQIVIGAGTQVLLNLLCGLIKNDCRVIGFEEPGFVYGRHVFLEHEFEVVPIPLEKDGLLLSELKEHHLKQVYVSPSNQFPTGAVMTIQKRLELLEWITQQKGLIIEDDYDSELRYFGRPIPSLQGLDREGVVVYIGSFSKILLPAIRVSYMVLPAKLLPALKEKIAYYNQTASMVEQLTLAKFMADDQLNKQIRKTRKIYARKNQLLVEQLERKMGSRVQILGKETGLHLLLEIHTAKDSTMIAKEAAAVGIKVTPLQDYHFYSAQTAEAPLVVMGYGGLKMEEIAHTVDKLAEVWFGL